MSRKDTHVKGNQVKWTIRLYNSSGALVDADSVPTVAVRKNGSSTADSVTVTKRTSTTGIYDCVYDPAGEVEGDQFTIEESATISGTTYNINWEFVTVDPMRGTDNSLLSSTFTTMFSGITSLAQWLGLLAGKQTADATALAEINATGAGSGTYNSTTDSQEAIRDNITAGSVTITPITSTVDAGVVSESSVTYYISEGKDITITVVDGDGNAIDMTSKTLVMIVEDSDKSDYFTIADGSISKGGAGGNELTITIPYSNVSRVGAYKYAIRDVVDPFRVWARGTLIIAYAPKVG